MIAALLHGVNFVRVKDSRMTCLDKWRVQPGKLTTVADPWDQRYDGHSEYNSLWSFQPVQLIHVVQHVLMRTTAYNANAELVKKLDDAIGDCLVSAAARYSLAATEPWQPDSAVQAMELELAQTVHLILDCTYIQYYFERSLAVVDEMAERYGTPAPARPVAEYSEHAAIAAIASAIEITPENSSSRSEKRRRK